MIEANLRIEILKFVRIHIRMITVALYRYNVQDSTHSITHNVNNDSPSVVPHIRESIQFVFVHVVRVNSQYATTNVKDLES